MGKLRVVVAWLKKIGSTALSLAAKRGAVEPGHPTVQTLETI